MIEPKERLGAALALLRRVASERECPVCGRAFRSRQGRGGHLAHSADAAHSAYASYAGYGRRFA